MQRRAKQLSLYMQALASFPKGELFLQIDSNGRAESGNAEKFYDCCASMLASTGSLLC